MAIGDMIHKLRTEVNLSQEQFGSIFGVSRQSVQKWENGVAAPEIDKLCKIAKYFGVTLDSLVMDNGTRIIEAMQYNKKIKPNYSGLHLWGFYASYLSTEYQQSIEEGLDIEKYKDIFMAVQRLPQDEIKKRFGDILFDIVINARTREGYKYIEPSELDEIKALRREYEIKGEVRGIEKKIYAAWLGRICGCMHGKPIECIKTHELIPFLKETGNYPMRRYIYSTDITDEIAEKYDFGFSDKLYADIIDGMPTDDDTNYVVIAQNIIEKYGRDFTSYDVSREWLECQGMNSYCTAERVAYCNFLNGYQPPESAIYKNPYREWIGAQIRGDYFGYINPGDPEAAADMAFRDASISHIKNGIYGEMFAAAMIACAAVTNNIKDIIMGGLAQIPQTSRLYESVAGIVSDYENGVSQQRCFEKIHEMYDEYTEHGWCHTISNAMIVAAALLYGKGDYGKSICMAVETGFDTDCNGATVGSVLGMMLGEIPEYWAEPIKDTLHTSIFGVGTVKITDMAKKTLKHLK